MNPNLEIARKLWDGIAQGDPVRLQDVLAEDCVFRMSGPSPLAGTFVGLDAIFDFMARVGELTDDLESTLVDVYTGSTGGVIRYAILASRSGSTLETEQLFVFRVEAGRIVEGTFATVDAEAYHRFFMPH